MLIKDIKPDAQSYNLDPNLFYYASTANCIIKDRETLKLIVDPPCLEACEYLFDCNILTTSSSANNSNYSEIEHGYKGWVGINYDSLSDENKKIYQMLLEKELIGKYGEYEAGGTVIHDFTICIPFDETTTSEEFSKELMDIVRFFQPQELMYGSYSREEMEMKADYILEHSSYVMMDGNENADFIEDYLYPKYGDKITMEDLVNECNNLIFHYYHDSEADRYWIDEGLYKKAVNSRNQKR